MKAVLFHQLAEKELQDFACFYEKKAKGLGDSFLDEIHQNIEQILEYPKMSPVVIKKIRRKTIQRFPFHILYELKDDSLYIIAIMHQRRNPVFWKDRI